MAILITGVAGLIGSHLLTHLLNSGERVIGIDNFETGNSQNIQKFLSNHSFLFYQNSIFDEQSLHKIFIENEVNVIVHFAALPRVPLSFFEPIKTANVNILGTILMLKYAQQYNVQRFIFASSASVYGEQYSSTLSETMEARPISPYGLQKLSAETFCKFYFQQHGIETICLRFFNVFGEYYLPNEWKQICIIPRIIISLLTKRTITIYNSGEQIRDFTYVEDIIAATIKVIYSNNKDIFGESINIGKGQGCTINYLFEQICNILGFGYSSIIHEQSAFNEPLKVVAENSKARSMLHWEPKFELRKALNKTCDFYKMNN